MGGRGANSIDNNVAINDIKGKNEEETNFIRKLANNFDKNGFMDSERMASEYANGNTKERDRLMDLAKQQQTVEFVRGLTISEPEVTEKEKPILGAPNKIVKQYTYTATDKTGTNVKRYTFNKKMTSSQVKKEILKNYMNNRPPKLR